MSHIKDLSGQRFGRLLVQKRIGSINGHSEFECLCDCGNITKVLGTSLLQGDAKSCGCYQKDHPSALNQTTGSKRARVKLRNIWSHMKRRCEDPLDERYPWYGARGITMCEEWNDFNAFCEWAMNNGFKSDAKGMECSLDRIDNEKGYSPSNCRFTDARTQANNRRRNVLITRNGETHTIAEWSRITGIKACTIQSRLHRGLETDEIFKEVY